MVGLQKLHSFYLVFSSFLRNLGKWEKWAWMDAHSPILFFSFFFLIIPTKQGNVMLTQFPFSSLLFLSSQTTQLCFSTCFSSPLCFSLFPRIPNTIYTHTYIHTYIYIYILKSSINVDFNIELHINYLKHTKTFNSNNLLIWQFVTKTQDYINIMEYIILKAHYK